MDTTKIIEGIATIMLLGLLPAAAIVSIWAADWRFVGTVGVLTAVACVLVMAEAETKRRGR